MSTSNQRDYFEKSYIKGVHGWPIYDPTPEVVRFVSRSKKILSRSSLSALDIGCGEGRHSFLLHNAGFETTAIDYSITALKRARLIARKKGIKGVVFVCGDIFNSRLAKKFDLVLDYGVFHHVLKRDRKDYLLKISNLLRPSGLFILSCFSLDTRRFFKLKINRSWRVHEGHYDKFYSEDEIRSYLSECFDPLTILVSNSKEKMIHVLAQNKSYLAG